MVGHYLLTLTEEQEDRVLTQNFAPVATAAQICWGCLCMTASGDKNDKTGVHNPEELTRGNPFGRVWRSPGWVYEYACMRFGVPRVNAAIRNRILTNRLWRMLENRPASLRAPS